MLWEFKNNRNAIKTDENMLLAKVSLQTVIYKTGFQCFDLTIADKWTWTRTPIGNRLGYIKRISEIQSTQKD